MSAPKAPSWSIFTPGTQGGSRAARNGPTFTRHFSFPAGGLLDAEGVRSLASLCHDFGMDPDLTEICRSPGSPSPDAGFARKLRRIVDLCGWSGGAPDARKIVTATMDWEAARRDFERHGGMGRDAERMLDAYIEELVLERRRTPGEVLESVVRSWLETSPETGATRAASRREISERYAHAFADEAETALKARFGQRIAVGIVDSDEMADAEGVEIPCFHALVRVGELYYDAEATGGVADPWNIPALCRARQSSLRSEPSEETGAAADPSPG
jgi:hypothetical protein